MEKQSQDMQSAHSSALVDLEKRYEVRLKEQADEASKLKTKQEKELKNINELNQDMISRIKKQHESTKALQID